MEIKDLYNLDETIAKPYLEKYKYPWEVLSNIKDIISKGIRVFSQTTPSAPLEEIKM